MSRWVWVTTGMFCAWLVVQFTDAGPTSAAQTGSGCVINELMYHPASEQDGHEYVEVTNTGVITVDLSGWFFDDGFAYTFPGGTLLPPGGYLVVAHDPAAVAAQYGLDPAVLLGPFADKRLSDAGERVALYDASGALMDQVTFDDASPWPVEPDGGGPALELINPIFDNDRACNWAASSAQGTPGAQNSVFALDVPPCVEDVSHAPTFPTSSQNPIITARVTDNGALITPTVYHKPDASALFDATPMRDDGSAADAVAGDSIYTAQLPAYADGTLVEFYIEAVDDAGLSTRVPAGAPGAISSETGAPLTIGYLFLVEDTPPASTRSVYRLLVSSENWAELTTRDLYSNALLDATFVYGDDVYYNVGLRYRGETSRPSYPKSYRVNFPSSHLFHPAAWGGSGGIQRLNLVADRIAREALTYDLFRRAGLTASDTEFVDLYIHTTYQGLTIAIEQVDEYFLGAHLPGDDMGNLYRGKDGGDLAYRGADPADYRAYYLKQNNEGAGDYSDVIALTAALTNSSADEFPAASQTVADMAQWVRWFAINAVVYNTEGALWVGQGDDYYLYHRPSDGRFILIPWDHDSTFGDAQGSIWISNLPIVQRILHAPLFTRWYYQNITSLAAAEFSAATMAPLIDALPSELDGEKAQLKQFVADRLGSLEAQAPDGALSISTNAGGSFSTTQRTLALEGTCSPVRDVFVNGSSAAVTYPTVDTWRYTAQLRPRANRFVVTDRDLAGQIVSTHTITVTFDTFDGGLLTESLTLTLAASPHVILQDIVAPAGLTLTIEPGVTVALAEGVSIFVAGQLLAEGSADQPITFTRDIDTDHWGVIGIYSSTQDNRLTYAVVEYAGQADYAGHTFEGVGVYNGYLILEDSEIRHTSHTALHLLSSTVVARRNQVHDAAAGPGLYAQSSALEIVDNLFFSLADRGLVLSQTRTISASGLLHNEIYGVQGDCVHLVGEGLALERNDLHHCTGAGVFLSVTHSLTLTNNLLRQNDVGMAVHSAAPVHLLHDTLAYNNTAGLVIDDPANQTALVNSIVWENGVAISHTIGASVSVAYSDVQGGWPGVGNIAADPQFRQSGAGVFRLLETSPCVDQATSVGAPPIDLMGIPRPEGAGYDMGAFEFFEYYSVYLPLIANDH